MEYWMILIDYDSYVSYGVDSAVYLGGIYCSKEEAEKALESDRIKKLIKEVQEIKGYDGDTEPWVGAHIQKYSEDMNADDLLLCRAAYME